MSCETASSSASSTGLLPGIGTPPGTCTVVLSDGQRYRCSSRFAQRLAPGLTPTSVFEHAKACNQLSRLVIPAALRAVASRIGKVRICLSAHSLRVVGGLVFPVDRGAGYAPAGELDVSPRKTSSTGGVVLHGVGLPGDALVGFYTDARHAASSARRVMKNVNRVGGQLERAGAESILWLTPPPHAVRDIFKACIGG
jgi:hypothetical protein